MGKRQSRWLSLFKRRAKTTGQAPSPAAQRNLGIDWRADDAKVDNSDPAEAFALNLNVELDRLFELESADEIFAYVTAHDDFEKPVETIPLSKTSQRIWFDFCSAGPTHTYPGDEVSVGQFVTDTCYILKDDMLPNQSEFDYLHLDTIDGLALRRITWDSALEAWYFQFE